MKKSEVNKEKQEEREDIGRSETNDTTGQYKLGISRSLSMEINRFSKLPDYMNLVFCFEFDGRLYHTMKN